MRIFDWVYIRAYPLDGLLFGLEWDWHYRYCTINLFIFRIVVDFDLASPQLKGL
jgi:hypothetical protein